MSKINDHKNLAVIFDMDGVIIDNTNYHIKAWENLCHKHNIIFDKEVYFAKINGRPIKEGITSLFSFDLAPENLDALCCEKDELYRELYKNEIVALKGLLPFLEHLAANNIPKAIATSANEMNVKFTLEGIGISRYFEIILDEKAVLFGKPNPEIYLKTAAALGVDPSLCVVFEDSISGITAAKNAGMKVIALTTTHPIKRLTDANMIKENFDNITINTLKSLFI